jgi:hypothetical protein
MQLLGSFSARSKRFVDCESAELRFDSAYKFRIKLRFLFRLFESGHMSATP